MPVGAVVEVGGSPGPVVRPRHPGSEEEENILQLHWRVERVQLTLWPQLCQAVSRGWAFPLSQHQVPSWGQETSRGSQAGPHKLPPSLLQPQPHLDVGVPG